MNYIIALVYVILNKIQEIGIEACNENASAFKRVFLKSINVKYVMQYTIQRRIDPAFFWHVVNIVKIVKQLRNLITKNKNI